MTDNVSIPDPKRSRIAGHRRLAFDPRKMRPSQLAEVLADSRIEVGPSDTSTIFARVLRLNHFAITHISAAEGAVVWRPSHGAGDNRFMFIFVAQGNLMITADETRFATTEEAILVAFPGKGPIRLSTAAPIEAMAFTFDAGEVAPLTLTRQTVRAMRPSSSVFLTSFQMLRTLVSSDTPESEEDSAAIRSLLLGAARALLRAARAPESTLLETASAIIAEQHTNPRLDAGSIAIQLNVSLSTLYRAYAGEAMSISEQLRRQRAETAMRLLNETPDISPTDLCRQSGFGSLSSLRRAVQAMGG
ncbi:helix-turn-helix domain-containing protein [Microbacterium arabinogalactanolyticum]|uniref:helix-turn-helix domain-containing protein n=1 Tax=Microbacterium arabinogalactanolyticum TaxID=69365 RepID=UPI00404408FF